MARRRPSLFIYLFARYELHKVVLGKITRFSRVPLSIYFPNVAPSPMGERADATATTRSEMLVWLTPANARMPHMADLSALTCQYVLRLWCRGYHLLLKEAEAS